MRELMRANRDKVGAPFQHPDCIIEWIMKVKAKNKSSYRDVVGDVEDKLLAMGLPPVRRLVSGTCGASRISPNSTAAEYSFSFT